MRRGCSAIIPFYTALLFFLANFVKTGHCSYYEYTSDLLTSANNVYGYKLLDARYKRQANQDGSEDEPDENQADRLGQMEKAMMLDYNSTGNATRETVQHSFYTLHIFNQPEKFDKEWRSVEQFKNDDKMNGSLKIDALANVYRRALKHDLPFIFPFYGHDIQNVTICTGGFIYLGNHAHPNLAATMYIAPLMADFETKGNESVIQFAQNSTTFIVEWHNLPLKNQPVASATMKNFTFQLRITDKGFIGFYYKDIPIPVSEITDHFHPQKVGVSDAFMVVQEIFDTFRRNLLVEYHAIEVNETKITNQTIVVLEPIDTCIEHDTCEECQKAVNCSWCQFSSPASDRKTGVCSDPEGLNRYHQTWQENRCHVPSAFRPGDSSVCSSGGTTVPVSTPPPASTPSSSKSSSSTISGITGSSGTASTQASKSEGSPPPKKGGLSGAAIFGIIVVVFLVIALGGWVFYAYRNPHSRSGQFLIQYRPSRWNQYREDRIDGYLT